MGIARLRQPVCRQCFVCGLSASRRRPKPRQIDPVSCGQAVPAVALIDAYRL